MNMALQVLALLGFVTATISARKTMALFPDQVGDNWVWRTDSIGSDYNPTTNCREIEGVDPIAGAQFSECTDQ